MNQPTTDLQDRRIQHVLADRNACRTGGLGHPGAGGAHIKLQLPLPISGGFATPQLERTDVAELRLQGDRNHLGLAFPSARCQYGPNRRQWPQKLWVNGHQGAWRISRAPARRVQGKLDGLANT